MLESVMEKDCFTLSSLTEIVNSGQAFSLAIALERFIWHDEIIDILLVLKSYNYNFILVTNQSGIGRGYYSLSDFNILNQAIIEKLKLFDLSIEIRFCPHKPENKCKCRKPNIGMVECDQRADKDIFIGDQITDMICAQNANIKHRWLINKL